MTMPMSALIYGVSFRLWGWVVVSSPMMIAALNHVPHPLHGRALSALMPKWRIYYYSFGPLIAAWLPNKMMVVLPMLGLFMLS